MSDNGGYGDPPKVHRFSKGVSGNPKGRPKLKPPVLNEVINKVRNTSTEYRDSGRMRTATRLELALRKMVNGAINGDVACVKNILKTRTRATKNNDVEVQKFVVEGGLPDDRVPSEEQMPSEQASKPGTDAVGLPDLTSAPPVSDAPLLPSDSPEPP